MSINFSMLCVKRKHKNREHIIDNLPGDWSIFIPKTTNENINFGREVHQEYMLNNSIFSKQLSEKEIARIEEWLGHPFHLILQYSHSWRKRYENNPKKLKEYYGMLAKLVVYYKEFFTKHKIELFSMDVSCRFPLVIGLLVAKKMKLKPIIIGRGRISQTMLIRDFNFQPIFWKKVNEDDIESAKKFFSERYSRKDKKQENPGVQRKNISKFSIIKNLPEDSQKLFRKVFHKRNEDILEKMERIPISQMISDKITRQVRKFIVPAFLEKPDLDSKYLFFPIHHDEETHLSWGEHFINQYDIMRKVAESLPVNTYLFIKPHPNWLCTDVPITKMRNLRKWKNVKLIPPELSAVELIRKSRGIITINSTTGIEAIALGKPLMTFGHNEYARDGIAVCVHDLKNLPAAVEKIVYSPEKSFNQRERDLFLARFYKHLIPYEGVGGTRADLNNEGGKSVAAEIKEYVEYLNRGG